MKKIFTFLLALFAVMSASAEEIVLSEDVISIPDWSSSQYVFSEDGTELKNAGAQVGDQVWFYVTGDKDWQFAVYEGHWGGLYRDYEGSFLTDDETGKPLNYSIASDGICKLTLTQEMFDKFNGQTQYWGGSFVIDGYNVTCTKISLVKKYTELAYESAGINDYDPVDVAGGTSLGSDAYGNTFETAFDDQVKLGNVKWSGYTRISVNGSKFSITGGYQGSTNPCDAEGTRLTQSRNVPAGGFALRINAANDGYMYVVGRFSNNKNYRVYEDNQPVSYTIVMDGTEAGSDSLGNSTVAKAIVANADISDVDRYYSKLGYLNGTDSLYANYGAGFIKFPIKKNSQYIVCAAGSKFIHCGTIFSETGNENIVLKGVDENTGESLADVTLEQGIAVTGVSLNSSNVELLVGQTETLTSIISPTDATYKNVKWASTNSEVATVSEDGVVTAICVGSAVVYAVSLDGGYSAGCVVKVSDYVATTGVTLDKSNLTLCVGGTATLKPIISPTDASNQSVEWYNSYPDVASVDVNGNVTGLAVGTTTITVMTDDGNYLADCNVTVVASGNGAYKELEYASIGGIEYTADCSAGTSLGTDAFGNTFETAFDDQVKLAAVAWSGYTTMSVNGVDYSISGGYQGSNNPKDANGSGVGAMLNAPASGSVLKINAAQDGYMYVVGKFSNNKQYVVFEDNQPIAYNIVIDGTPAGVDTLGNSTTATAMVASVSSEDISNCITNGTPMPKLGILNGLGASAANNGAGFIKFAVKAGSTYLVSASGSKLTQCGTIFSETGSEFITLKGADENTGESLEDVVLEPAKVITTGIDNVVAENTDKAVKTIVNGKLFIMKNGKTYSVTGAVMK